MSKSLKSCLRCWCSKCVVNEGGAAKVEWFLRMGECMEWNEAEKRLCRNGMGACGKGKIGCVCGVLCMKMRCVFCV